eukprot:3613076-Prymnesium_polylepis.1
MKNATGTPTAPPTACTRRTRFFGRHAAAISIAIVFGEAAKRSSAGRASRRSQTRTTGQAEIMAETLSGPKCRSAPAAA